MDDLKYLIRENGERIAYLSRSGQLPGLLWLGGFKSEMDGNKARALDSWAEHRAHSFVRFDYFGHGRSSGDFADGSITRWHDDALEVLDTIAHGPQILVGSSMGAWLALLCARVRPERVQALFLIAPATDFTEALLWRQLPEPAKDELTRNGRWLRPSLYDDKPYLITRSLIEDGRKHLLLDQEPIRIACPVRIVQGMRDPDVPWTHAMKLVEAIEGDVQITLVKGGDHRLSTPSDLGVILRGIENLIEELGSKRP